MKTGEAGFRFPVIGFTPDGEIWGFADVNTLTSCGPKTLRDNKQDGMELIDARGRRWRVLSITRTGRGEPLLLWLLSALLSTPQSRIEHDLEPLEPISLDEVKARVCASLKAFPEDYGAYEGMEEVLEKLLRQVKSSKSVRGVYGLPGLDSFMAY